MNEDDPLPLWFLAFAVLSLSISVKLFLLREYWSCFS